MPPYLSSKLYFRMWNYYCGKLQLCWKLYCQPVNINDDSIPTKCCTRTSMNSRMNEKSKYHITTTTTVSELWNSDLKNRNRRRISRQITADQVDPNSKTHLWNESEKNWYINVCNIFLFSLQLLFTYYFDNKTNWTKKKKHFCVFYPSDYYWHIAI